MSLQARPNHSMNNNYMTYKYSILTKGSLSLSQIFLSYSVPLYRNIFQNSMRIVYHFYKTIIAVLYLSLYLIYFISHLKRISTQNAYYSSTKALFLCHIDTGKYLLFYFYFTHKIVKIYVDKIFRSVGVYVLN